MAETKAIDFDRLSVAEKIQYVQDLWDRIVSESADEIPRTDAQAAELDRRLAAHLADPAAAIPWDEAKKRLRDRR